MSTTQETLALLTTSLRTRRDILGNAAFGASREALRHFTATNFASHRNVPQQTVTGVGNPQAQLAFVSEADGEHQRKPFAGPAGKLFAKIITAMGLSQEDVYVVSILKHSSTPSSQEIQNCRAALKQEIARIHPHVLVALGKTAMLGLVGAKEPMNALRGTWFSFENTPLLPTYHPSYLLHNSALSEKRKVWEDMLLVMEKLQLPISEKQRGYFRSGQ